MEGFIKLRIVTESPGWITNRLALELKNEFPQGKLIYGLRRNIEIWKLFSNFSKEYNITYFLPYFLFDKRYENTIKVSLLTHHEPNNPMKAIKWDEAIQNSDYLIAISKIAYDKAIDSGVDPSKISIIHYGVSAIYRPTFNILIVGAPGVRKGEEFLSQVRNLLSHNPSIIWKSASHKGWGLETICDSAENLKLAYDWADLLLVPSDLEGAHTGTLEAIFSGLPVLTRLTGLAAYELNPYVTITTDAQDAALQIDHFSASKLHNSNLIVNTLENYGFTYNMWRQKHLELFKKLIRFDNQ